MFTPGQADKRILKKLDAHADPDRAARGENRFDFQAGITRLINAGLLRSTQIEVDGAPFNTLVLTPAGAAAIA